MATLVWQSSGNTTDKTTIDIPAGILLENTQYEFRARHSGTATGDSSWGSKIVTTKSTFGTTNTPTVAVAGSPSSVDEAAVISTTSAFAVSSGTDTHYATSWQVFNSSNVLVWESLNDTVNKTTITMPTGTLQAGATYTFKAAHIGTVAGASAYGSITATTKSSFGITVTPTLTVEGQDISVPEDPTVTTSAFAVSSGTDTHYSTDWEIWTV